MPTSTSGTAGGSRRADVCSVVAGPVVAELPPCRLPAAEAGSLSRSTVRTTITTTVANRRTTVHMPTVPSTLGHRRMPLGRSQVRSLDDTGSLVPPTYDGVEVGQLLGFGGVRWPGGRHLVLARFLSGRRFSYDDGRAAPSTVLGHPGSGARICGSYVSCGTDSVSGRGSYPPRRVVRSAFSSPEWIRPMIASAAFSRMATGGP